MEELFTIQAASRWASQYLKKTVTTSNISYLIQYGRIKKYTNYGNTVVSKTDLIEYYNSLSGRREHNWKAKLGADLNWALSFDWCKEKDTTKHVHRLHPYKGKFIPQLVEYFLDDHVDHFKKHVYFKSGDIILDPFSGSGTTMVQANELGIHVIGIDISAFNCLIANVKIAEVDFQNLAFELNRITLLLKNYSARNDNSNFERELLEVLSHFNRLHFPSPDFKIKVRQKELDEKIYATEKERVFSLVFERLVQKYALKIKQNSSVSFLEKWYLEPVKNEINFVFEHLKKVKNLTTKKIITLILSRTIRTCRATTHADLATLKEPVVQTYYCRKHGKICKPLFSILSWWERYSKDTLKRLADYSKLKTPTYQICLQGDAQKLAIFSKLKEKHRAFGELAERQKLKGIFSSPPYLGLINYHEQHAYAYELFGFRRQDELEIGSLFKGQSKVAQQNYVTAIAQVLSHAKQYLQTDYDVFLVSNDKYNLYPKIAQKAGLQIVNQYKRPVLNRTEKDKSAYAELIFHLKVR